MRKYDDAHRPLRGKGQRGNRAGVPANWGGAELIEHDVAAETAARECQHDNAIGDEWNGRCPDCGVTWQTVYAEPGQDLRDVVGVSAGEKHLPEGSNS